MRTGYLNTLFFIVLVNSSASISSNILCAPEMPAFAKNTSKRPYFDTASSTTPLTATSLLASKHRA